MKLKLKMCFVDIPYIEYLQTVILFFFFFKSVNEKASFRCKDEKQNCR